MTKNQKPIAVVTGANTGLGLQTSIGLAKAGYTVVLACRNENKAQAAMDKIQRKQASATLDFIPLDLIDRNTIQRFGETFSERYDHLDLLINNAGVMSPPYTITPNALELQFDANHIGHFYLTSLLLSKLDQEFETRIVNVSSLAAKRDWADINFDNLNFEGLYNEGPKLFGLSGMQAYSQSKLANVLFTIELANRLANAGKNIKAVIAHPGVSATDLGRHMPVYLRLLAPILAPMLGMSKPAEGAESILYAALDSGVKSGDFIGPSGKGERRGPPGLVPLPPKASDEDSDEELRRKLWALSEEKLGVAFAL